MISLLKANMSFIERELNLKFKTMPLLTDKKHSCTKGILQVWGDVLTVFHLYEVRDAVKEKTGNYYSDTTVSSKLRALRKKDKIGFICIDYSDGLYKKLF